ncbi:MAG: cell wall hydrolase [Lachnospiraceae bacterium]|nr:cell wall hydrolase [Lachnospiraceae bacterium]
MAAQLGRDGRAAMAVYAEAAPLAVAEETLEKSPEGTLGEEKPGGEAAEDWKEGRMLAGEALAEEVLALRQARRQRQEGIEQMKAARREEEKGQQKGEEKARTASSVISYSQKDYEVLKRIVEAEAGICDTKGRILVANVVINRVKDSGFPDTITGVVYQKSQFSPVSDGSLDSCTVTPETVEAVDRALAGEDYSQGALYFMNRRRSKSGNVSWFDKSLTYLFQHDRHEFFK